MQGEIKRERASCHDTRKHAQWKRDKGEGTEGNGVG